MTDHSRSDPTDPTDPTDATTAAEDELVSAVVDGEATADERTLVENDPRLRARRDSFTRVRGSLGAVPAVPDATRESAITTALDSAEVHQRDVDSTPPKTVRLDRDRTHRRRQVATILAAAAAILIAVPLLAIALSGRGTEQDVASTGVAADESTDALASGGAADAAPSSTTASPEAASGFAVVFAGDLGSIGSASQLRAEVEGALASAGRSLAPRSASPQSSTTAPSQAPNVDADDPSADACGAAVAASDPTLGSLVLTATATWSDEPAVVLVFRSVVPAAAGEQPDALADIIVLARPDCTTIGRFVA
jgi:negative regulator of sigma E activity